MQPREAFRLGFLARCVEEGLSSEDTRALAKTAADYFEKAGSGWKALVDAGKAVGYPTAGLALAAPPALGGMAAYLSNSATDTDATEVDEIKKQELLQTYKRMADQLKRQKQLRDYKAKRQQTGQVFL